MKILWHCNRCHRGGVITVIGRTRSDKAKGLRHVVGAHEDLSAACDGGISTIEISVKTEKKGGKGGR